MKTSSIKQKGRRLQNFVAGVFAYISKIYGLNNGDILPRQMGGSGVDIIFSPSANKFFKFDIECKQVEKLNVVSTFNKHARNYSNTGNIPLLIHSKNDSRVLVTMDFNDFISILYSDKVSDFGWIKTINSLKSSWTSITKFIYKGSV